MEWSYPLVAFRLGVDSPVLQVWPHFLERQHGYVVASLGCVIHPVVDAAKTTVGACQKIGERKVVGEFLFQRLHRLRLGGVAGIYAERKRQSVGIQEHRAAQ